MLGQIRENALVDKLTGNFSRSPLQMNRVHGSDSEIVRIPGTDGRVLAATIDSICEEILTGLYDDPWQMGWMAVMVNMSDLAAVGALPLGILISETLKTGMAEEALLRIQQGIREACQACGTYVLGGDTNFGPTITISGCALGIVEEGTLLSRTGCRPGEALYASGPLGGGNAFAAEKLIAGIPSPTPFKPLARLKQGQMLTRYASCCMDTSDGALATLDELMRLNGCGFSLSDRWRSTISAASRSVVAAMHVPEWLLLAGEHGEFELIFTVPRAKEAEFLLEARSEGWSPVLLGECAPDLQVRMEIDGREVAVDTGEIRNLSGAGGRDVRQYLKSLLEIDENMKRS